MRHMKGTRKAPAHPGFATLEQMVMATPDGKALLTSVEIAAVPEIRIRHPWNANSDVPGSAPPGTW